MRRHCFILKVLFVIIAVFCFQTGGNPFLVLIAKAEETEMLTLSLAVDKAFENNPVIRATLSGRKIADAQLREARAGLFPLLQFNEIFTRSNNPVFVFGSLLEQGRFGLQNFQINSLNNPDPLSNFRTQVFLQQPLFDQWQTPTRVAQARIGQRQADIQKEAVQQQLRFDTIRAYYGVLVAQAGEGVAKEAVKMGEAVVKQTRDRFQAGLAVQSDLLAAEVQLAEFRQQLIQAEGDLASANGALNTALGISSNAPQNVVGELVDKTFEVTQDQEELIRLALKHRPDYIHAGFTVQSNQEGVKGARARYLPRFDAFANYGVSGKDLTSGSSDYAFGASLSMNLFDPGRRARLARAMAEENMATAEKEDLSNQIRLEVTRAYYQYISARDRRGVAARAITQAEEALRIVEDRYREGLTTITEVLRAETALIRARMNLLGARYEHYVGYAHVLLATGRLVDVQPFVS